MTAYQNLNRYAVILADPAKPAHSKDRAAFVLREAGYCDHQIEQIRMGRYAGPPQGCPNSTSQRQANRKQP